MHHSIEMNWRFDRYAQAHEKTEYFLYPLAIVVGSHRFVAAARFVLIRFVSVLKLTVTAWLLQKTLNQFAGNY